MATELYEGLLHSASAVDEAPNSGADLRPATIETLQYASLLYELKVPVLDCVPEVLNPETESNLNSVQTPGSDVESGEAYILKAKALSKNHPNRHSKVHVWKKRRKNVVESFSTARNETVALALGRHNPNIVQLNGVALNALPSRDETYWEPILLLEFTPLKDLSSFINGYHGDPNKVPLATRISLLADVAHGIQFLHDNGIIWGDAKPQNILVFETFSGAIPYRAKLADFGEAKLETKLRNHGGSRPFDLPKGTLNWQAPYHFYGKHLASQSDLVSLEFQIAQCYHCDVFAFGLLILWSVVGEQRFLNWDYLPTRRNQSHTGGFATIGVAVKAFGGDDISDSAQKLVLRALEEDFDTLRLVQPGALQHLAISGALKNTLQFNPVGGVGNAIDFLTGALPRHLGSSASSVGVLGTREVRQTITPEDVRSYLLGEMDSKELDYSLRMGFEKHSGMETIRIQWPGRATSSSELTSPMQAMAPMSLHLACNLLVVEDVAKLLQESTEDVTKARQALDGEGRSPLAYAIRSDDPSTELQRHERFGDDYLERQEQVIRLLCSGPEAPIDVHRCSINGESPMIWCAKHGSLATLQFLERIGESVSGASMATDGSVWTVLRAAMARADASDLFCHVLAKTDPADVAQATFERNYSYLHLCTFLDGRWAVDVAKALICHAFPSSVDLVAEDPETHLRYTPFGLAAMRGNMRLAQHFLLLGENRSDPYFSVIPPAIRPPRRYEGWFETAIIPSRQPTRGWIHWLIGNHEPGARSILDWLIGLSTEMSLDFGEYSEEEASAELSQERHDLGRVWTTIHFTHGVIPCLRRQRKRLTYRFLLWYGEDAGYCGPFMETWLKYRTILDQAVIDGHRTVAVSLARQIKDMHPRIIERAIGTGIRLMYLYRENLLPSAETLDPETRDRQSRVYKNVEKIVTDLVEQLLKQEKAKNEILRFFTRPIKIDLTNPLPESFFQESHVMLGMTPESVTTLCHLAALGENVKLVEMLVDKLSSAYGRMDWLRRLWYTFSTSSDPSWLERFMRKFYSSRPLFGQDGAGLTPLDRTRAQMKELARRGLPDEHPRLKNLKDIERYLKNSIESRDEKTSFVGSFIRWQRETLSAWGWVIFLSIVAFFPMLAWRPLENKFAASVEGYISILVVVVGSILATVLYVMKIVLGLPHVLQSWRAAYRRGLLVHLLADGGSLREE